MDFRFTDEQQMWFDTLTSFNGMQAIGGYAQLAEYDMERYCREVKHATVGGETPEVQRSIIAGEAGL